MVEDEKMRTTAVPSIVREGRGVDLLRSTSLSLKKTKFEKGVLCTNPKNGQPSKSLPLPKVLS
jgi:hypothetical protein